MRCTFFGNRNASFSIEPMLYSVLTDLVKNKNVDMFYVGNQGNFDAVVRKCLRRLKKEIPHINYAVVLAYMPSAPKTGEDYSDTVYPEVLDKVPYRFAIAKRNQWMVSVSDYVVTYVRSIGGGAAKNKDYAERQGKSIIEISDILS